MRRALILSGGIFHDFPATSAFLADLARHQGLDVEVTEDLEAGLRALTGVDLLVVNALRWRMEGEKYEPYRRRWAYSPSTEAREALRRHLREGRGVLAVHTAVICFDDWPEWGDLLGARWRWGASCHPPLGRVRVQVHEDAHPLVEGIEGFEVEDEVYSFLEHRARLIPLIVGEHGGISQPLLWAREGSAGRVVVDTLGHGLASLSVPEHRTILGRAMRWLLS
ncbi:MAG TPA: ThuA domain-containing protein [Candidatus Dormibacteraeota bacterium]|nr:ThuA domain-containing protein [Candidatus Dormibacteraeota bacterium]